MRRWLPLLCIAGLFFGLHLLLAQYRATFEFLQIAIFAILIIALTAWGEGRKPSQMKGCMTILSMLFGPFLALLMALVDLLATWSALDPALGWAGGYRLPALLFMTGAALTLITGLVGKLRGKKRLRFPEAIGDVLLGIFIAAWAGGLSSVAGFIWLGIGYGLNWAGL